MLTRLGCSVLCIGRNIESIEQPARNVGKLWMWASISIQSPCEVVVNQHLTDLWSFMTWWFPASTRKRFKALECLLEEGVLLWQTEELCCCFTLCSGEFLAWTVCSFNWNNLNINMRCILGVVFVMPDDVHTEGSNFYNESVMVLDADVFFKWDVEKQYLVFE